MARDEGTTATREWADLQGRVGAPKTLPHNATIPYSGGGAPLRAGTGTVDKPSVGASVTDGFAKQARPDGAVSGADPHAAADPRDSIDARLAEDAGPTAADVRAAAGMKRGAAVWTKAHEIRQAAAVR